MFVFGLIDLVTKKFNLFSIGFIVLVALTHLPFKIIAKVSAKKLTSIKSSLELVNEVKNELNYDLTYFYENKLGKE